MDGVGRLESGLEEALQLRRTTECDLRDALVDYYAIVARPHVVAGLRHTQPDADDAVVRRLMVARVGTLWGDLPSPWGNPTLIDLKRFKDRIDRYACISDDPSLDRVNQLLEQLFLAATVRERLPAARARRFKIVARGSPNEPPRGRLHLVPRDDP